MIGIDIVIIFRKDSSFIDVAIVSKTAIQVVVNAVGCF